MRTEGFYPVQSGLGVKLIALLYEMSRIGISGAIPLFTLHALTASTGTTLRLISYQMHTLQTVLMPYHVGYATFHAYEFVAHVQCTRKEIR